MKSIDVDSEDDGDMLARALHVESVSQHIHTTNWVTIRETEYRPVLVICCEIEHEMPVFCRKEKVFVINSVICFLVNKLVVDHFSDYVHAYKVFESNDKDAVKADSLVIYKPFDLQRAYGGDESQYIVPLFSL